MFQVLSSGRPKRRIMSPTTVALSIGAHVLLLGGVAVGMKHQPPAVETPYADSLTWIVPEPVPPEPPKLDDPVVRPAPDAPAQPRGNQVVLDPPVDMPTIDPRLVPSGPPVTPDQVTGVGTPGIPDGDPTVTDPAPVQPVVGGGDEPYQPSAVEERPALRNAAEMQRVLQRLYPDLLREAGVAGTTSLQFVVGPDGRVEEGSVQVVSTSNPAFAEPSVKAAERFRFRPAKVGGRAVRVLISMPIAWTLDR
ncbi:MAG TPA: TonB family protein [Longimicrobiaceae bacterium]